MFLNLALLGLAVLLLSTVIRGAPFVPTKASAVARMVEVSKVQPGMYSLDIGSGDGRIVIAMATAGAMAHGYEINPCLVWWSKYKIYKAGLNGRAFVHWGNFWNKNFEQYDIITVFGIGRIMKELERKLQTELKPGGKVISYVFRFPTWEIKQTDGAIFLYEKQKDAANLKVS